MCCGSVQTCYTIDKQGGVGFTFICGQQGGGRIQLCCVHRAQGLDPIRCAGQKGCLSLKTLFEGKDWKEADVFDVFAAHSIISFLGKRVRRASLSRMLPRPLTDYVVQEELAFCFEKRCVPGQRLSTKRPVMSRLLADTSRDFIGCAISSQRLSIEKIVKARCSIDCGTLWDG